MSLLPRAATLPSNAQLSALLDGVDDSLLLLLDARRRVSYRNPVAHRLLGCESGLPLADALPWLDHHSHSALRQALAGAALPAVVPLLVTDGPRRGQPLQATLVRGPGGGWSLRAPAALPAPAPATTPAPAPAIHSVRVCAPPGAASTRRAGEPGWVPSHSSASGPPDCGVPSKEAIAVVDPHA